MVSAARHVRSAEFDLFKRGIEQQRRTAEEFRVMSHAFPLVSPHSGAQAAQTVMQGSAQRPSGPKLDGESAAPQSQNECRLTEVGRQQPLGRWNPSMYVVSVRSQTSSVHERPIAVEKRHRGFERQAVGNTFIGCEPPTLAIQKRHVM